MKLVWRREDGRVLESFTHMTMKDVEEALAITREHLSLIRETPTQMVFESGYGPLYLTLEVSDEDD